MTNCQKNTDELLQASVISSDSQKSVQERYQEKDFWGSSHWWIKSKLVNIPNGSHILDVGPGSGYMAKFLKSCGNFNLTAIEIDAETRQLLSNDYNLILEDLNKYTGPKFDYVFLLDVLEHMSQPEKFLLDLNDHLSTTAKIYISLPNVAHWSVRIPLLFGFFEYTNRGLLDRTHLQLFNRRRVKAMIKKASFLRLKEISSSIEPVEFVLPEFLTQNKIFQKISKFRLWLAINLPGFFAYQHLIELEKK